jgi:hypothetical protein
VKQDDAARSVSLSDADKLDVLRRLDTFREWRSLNDKRYCLGCGKIISGTEIQVVGGTRPLGPVRLICPTSGCDSVPMDWALPTDEMLAQERSRATRLHAAT